MNDKNPDIIIERGDKVRLDIDHGMQGQTLDVIITGSPVWNAFERRFDLRVSTPEAVAWRNAAEDVDVNKAGTEQAADYPQAPEARHDRRVENIRRFEDERAVDETAERLCKLPGVGSYTAIGLVRMIAKHDVANHRLGQSIKRAQAYLELNRKMVNGLDKRVSRLETRESAGEQILRMLDAMEALMRRSDEARDTLKNENDVLKARVDGLVREVEALTSSLNETRTVVRGVMVRQPKKRRK